MRTINFLSFFFKRVSFKIVNYFLIFNKIKNNFKSKNIESNLFNLFIFQMFFKYVYSNESAKYHNYIVINYYSAINDIIFLSKRT